MPRHFAFIDSQNLNLAIKDQGWKLNFTRFRQYLADKYNVEKAFLFIGFVEGNEDLYSSLDKAGYTLIYKPTLEFKREGERVTKGNVDAELVLHAMIEFPNYDKAIIVSGDGDFHCLLEYLEQHGKLLHVLIPNPTKYSALLRKFHTYFAYISSLKKKLSYSPSPREKKGIAKEPVKAAPPAPARPNRNANKSPGQHARRRSRPVPPTPRPVRSPVPAAAKPPAQVPGTQKRKKTHRGGKRHRNGRRRAAQGTSPGARQAT